MSDKFSQEEIDALVAKDDNISELEPLIVALNSCIQTASESLATITNIEGIFFEEPSIEICTLNDISFTDGDVLVKIGLKSGLVGYSYFNMSESSCDTIAKSMTNEPATANLPEEIVNSALSEAMNQMIGGICTTLSRSLNDTIDITTPDVMKSKKATTSSMFNGGLKADSNVCKFSYNVKIGNEISKLVFVFLLNTGKSAAFKIKTTESKNLLKLNPELAKTIAEFFALLGVKYKSIYSMLGVMSDVSIMELNSVHSLQCLDIEVINNYNILNKNQREDLYNVFIFEKDFVSDIKDTANLNDDEESTWDILKELNNNFIHIFLEYCSDNKLMFDNVECNNFLELPDNQYLLVSYSVGEYKFYQLLSFALVDKIKTNISKADRKKIDIKNMDKLIDENYEIKNEVESEPSISYSGELPEIYKKVTFEISAELANKASTIKDLLHINVGYIINFNKKVMEDIDIYINGVKKAEGEVGELTFNKSNNYAVKIKKFTKE